MRKLVLIAVVLAAAYFGGVESGLIPRQPCGRLDQA